MGQPVKVSEELLAHARTAGHALNRSTAGQIEFWALLGRALEPVLDGGQMAALRRAGRGKPLSAMLASVDSEEGRRRLRAHLKRGPFPRYEPAPGRPGLLVRTETGGRKTLGRFVGREFQASR